jgi:hypothetical protein
VYLRNLWFLVHTTMANSLSGGEIVAVWWIWVDQDLDMKYVVFICGILYCTVLYCTVLYCTVLYCTVLYLYVLLGLHHLMLWHQHKLFIQLQVLLREYYRVISCCWKDLQHILYYFFITWFEYLSLYHCSAFRGWANLISETLSTVPLHVLNRMSAAVKM